MRHVTTISTTTPNGDIIESAPFEMNFDFTQTAPSLTVANPVFSIANRMARTTFSFTLQMSNRMIYLDEYIDTTLDVFSLDNAVSEVKCKVTLGTVSTPSFAWGSCYFVTSTLATLRIVAIADTPSTTYVKVTLYGLRVPRTPINDYLITATLYNQNDPLQLIVTSPGVSLPTRLADQSVLYS